MKYKLICCAVFRCDMKGLLSSAPHRFDVQFMEMGMHVGNAENLRENLQRAIDAARDSNFDAVLIGYALCNQGLIGLCAREHPLIVPRAFDCIQMYFGNPQRYTEYFKKNKNTYFKSVGWMEHRPSASDLPQSPLEFEMDFDYKLSELTQKYGEEHARMIYEQLHQYRSRYQQITYLATGCDEDELYEEKAREEARARDLKFERIHADLGILRKLVNGEWDEASFLIVPPGEKIIRVYDDRIIACEKPDNIGNTIGHA